MRDAGTPPNGLEHDAPAWLRWLRWSGRAGETEGGEPWRGLWLAATWRLEGHPIGRDWLKGHGAGPLLWGGVGWATPSLPTQPEQPMVAKPWRHEHGPLLDLCRGRLSDGGDDEAAGGGDGEAVDEAGDGRGHDLREGARGSEERVRGTSTFVEGRKHLNGGGEGRGINTCERARDCSSHLRRAAQGGRRGVWGGQKGW